MKRTLLTLILLASLKCFGQVDGYYHHITHPVLTLDLDTVKGLVSYSEIDTVECMMLVSDTSSFNYTFHEEPSRGDTIVLTRVKECSNTVEWMHGLEVVSRLSLYDYYGYDVWTHEKYLDKSGDRLPEGIVVWQSIRTKN